MSPMNSKRVPESETMVLVCDGGQWLTPYLIVVIVTVDVVPVEGYSEVRSNGIDVDRLELSRFEGRLFVVW